MQINSERNGQRLTHGQVPGLSQVIKPSDRAYRWWKEHCSGQRRSGYSRAWDFYL